MSRQIPIGIAVMLGLSAIAILGAGAAGLRINPTDSMPRGLWRLISRHGPLHRGDIVIACLPDNPITQLAMRRGYFWHSHACPSGIVPVVKPVVAVAGDIVRVTAAGIAVDGVPVPNSALLTRDSAGRKITPVAPGTYHVRPGQMWLISNYNRRSFDSRYLGPVPVSGVQGLARPVWTFR